MVCKNTILKEKLKKNKVNDTLVNEQCASISLDLIMQTKLCIPNLPKNYIERTLLLNELDSVLSKKAVSINAPAGYGKTVLVNSWLKNHEKNIKKAWYSIDSDDNDPQRFWGYLAITIMKELCICDIDNGNSLLELFSYSCEFLINTMVSEVSKSSEHIVVILDDFHKICDKEIIDKFKYMIEIIPDNLHIVILSRYLPAVFLAKIRLSGCLLELEDKALILTKNEISEYVHNLIGLKLSQNEIDIIYRVTEGWMAAIELMGLAIREHGNVEHFLSKISIPNKYIMEYLFQEVFSLQDKETQDFLLKTSIFDVLNASLCDWILDRSDSQTMLRKLERDNLFLTGLDSHGHNYKYHNLFSQFLKNELVCTYPRLDNELYLKASIWYEENNYIKEAIKYSMKSENYENCARILEHYGSELMFKKEMKNIVYFIESLPNRLVSQSASLSLMYALALSNLGLVNDEETLFNKYGIRFDNNIFANYRGQVAVIRLFTFLYSGNIEEVLKLSSFAIEHLTDRDYYYFTACTHLIHACILTCDLNKAERVLKEQVASMQNTKGLNEKCIYTIYKVRMSQILIRKGKMRLAKELLEELLQMTEYQKSLPKPILNFIHLELGYIYCELNELDLAKKYINKCIKQSNMIDDFGKVMQAYVILARIYYAEKKFDDAAEYIKTIDRTYKDNGVKLIISNWFADVARILIAAQDMDYLIYIMRKYNIGNCDSSSLLYNDEKIGIAYIYINNKQFDKALYLLEKLADITENGNLTIDKINIRMLLAITYKHMDENNKALSNLRKAVLLACEEGLVYSFLTYGHEVKDLLSDLALHNKANGSKHNEIIEYAIKILNDLEINSFKKEEASEYTSINLSTRELDVIRLISFGYTNKEISSKLFIAECTVKKHISNILCKLNVKNRTHAITLAKKLKIL